LGFHLISCVLVCHFLLYFTVRITAYMVLIHKLKINLLNNKFTRYTLVTINTIVYTQVALTEVVYIICLWKWNIVKLLILIHPPSQYYFQHFTLNCNINTQNISLTQNISFFVNLNMGKIEVMQWVGQKEILNQKHNSPLYFFYTVTTKWFGIIIRYMIIWQRIIKFVYYGSWEDESTELFSDWTSHPWLSP